MESDKEVLNILESIYDENGYVTYDEILTIIEKYNISLFEIDRITSKLLLKGVIIIDEKESADDKIEDWSHLDYNSIFNEAIRIEPELKEYIEQIRKIKPPQKGEEKNLLIQAKTGNKYAKNRIIEMYLKNIVKIALDYYNRYGISIVDSIETGNIGLIKALEKIDLSVNDRLSVYMYFRIKSEIDRSILFSNAAIYFPAHIKENILSIIEILKKYGNIEYTDNLQEQKQMVDEIEAKTNLCFEEIKQIYIFIQDAISIDDLDEKMLSDNNQETIKIDNDFLKIDLNCALKSLKEKQLQVLKLRYGITSDGKERTLNEVGNLLGITRERVRQIEQKALNNLRDNNEIKKLVDYL